MQLPPSRVTLPNFHFLDMKTKNICLAVNLNAYLSWQRLYRHFACNLELSVRPWRRHGLPPESAFTKCTDSAWKPSETTKVCIAHPVVLLRSSLQVSRHCTGHSPPLAPSLNSEKPDPGGPLRFQTLVGNQRKGFPYWLGSVLDSHLIWRLSQKQVISYKYGFRSLTVHFSPSSTIY